MNKAKKIAWAVGIVGILMLIAFIWTISARPMGGGTQNTVILLLFGLFLGAIIAFLALKLASAKTSDTQIITGSHTVVESIRKVFKIVTAEGQLNEIYNYENTKKLLKFIPSTKKALVLVRAKVLIGYDIEKCRWEVDDSTKTIRLLEFPKPEIFSIDPDLNYYYFEDDLFNFIGRSDLQEIQTLAKDQVRKAALQSSLIRNAAEQMKLLLSEVVQVNQWKIENLHLIDDYAYPAEPTNPELPPAEETDLTKKENLWDKAIHFLNQ